MPGQLMAPLTLPLESMRPELQFDLCAKILSRPRLDIVVLL